MLSSKGKIIVMMSAAATVALIVVVSSAIILSGPSAASADGSEVVAGENSGEQMAESVHWRPDGGQYAISSAHEIATEAGLEMIEAGGTAADAAIAVAGALTIVEPWFSSVLGGGTWALYYHAESGRVTSLDGVGPAPQAATVEALADRAGERGMHQANMPGAWDGWMLWLEEYGTLELEEILRPAIEAAEAGYGATPRLIQWLNINRGNHFLEPAFAYGESMYSDIEEEGDTVYQREQAQTFRSILDAYRSARDDGRSSAIQAARDYVYRGPIAEAIVEYSNEYDGLLAIEDFADFEAQIVEPISISYRDIEVFQNPPNSQGITQLILLKILEGFDMSGYELDDPDAVHLQVEATKLAFSDRHHHVGDPDFVDVPVSRLLSEEHIRARREQIYPDDVLEWPIDPLIVSAPSTDRKSVRSGSGTPDPAPVRGQGTAGGVAVENSGSDYDGHSTTTFHIIDAEGNAAAVTTSLGAQFLVVGESGIHINSRMTMMHRDPDNPNVIEPGKKVRHTSSPYMAFRGGAPFMLGGNTGGDTQPQAQAQQFIAYVEFGATPDEAVSRRRFISRGFPGVSYPHRVGNDIRFEDGFSEQTIAALEARGHEIYDGGTGGLEGSAYMLVVDPETGEMQFGADPRDGVGSGEVRRME